MIETDTRKWNTLYKHLEKIHTTCVKVILNYIYFNEQNGIHFINSNLSLQETRKHRKVSAKKRDLVGSEDQID